MSNGYVYQFEMRPVLQKVGGSSTSWETRRKDAQTWVERDPEVVAVWAVDDWKSSEKRCHEVLKSALAPNRKELFFVDRATCLATLQSVLGLPSLSSAFPESPATEPVDTVEMFKVKFLSDKEIAWKMFRLLELGSMPELLRTRGEWDARLRSAHCEILVKYEPFLGKAFNTTIDKVRRLKNAYNSDPVEFATTRRLVKVVVVGSNQSGFTWQEVSQCFRSVGIVPVEWQSIC